MKRIIAALLATTCTLVISAAPAHAQPGGVPEGTRRVTVQMTLDCSTLTAKGVEYATQHKICGYGATSTSAGTVTPQGSSTFDCGTSYVDITAVSGTDVYLKFGAKSTKGWILNYRLDAWWEGSAGSGVITRSGFSATSNISFTGTATKVGRGGFETSLTGWAVVPIGTCTVAGASDYAWI